MATTVTVMHDTQTHATVLINADGAGLAAGTIEGLVATYLSTKDLLALMA
jgi:hypothetical protein